MELLMVKMEIDSMTLEAVSANAPHAGLNEGLKKKKKKRDNATWLVQDISTGESIIPEDKLVEI